MIFQPFFGRSSVSCLYCIYELEVFVDGIKIMGFAERCLVNLSSQMNVVANPLMIIQYRRIC